MKNALEPLRFVRGAVSTKDLVPEMKHFVIEDGAVRAFNGVLAISCPLDLDMTCAPKAVTLVHAIENCKEETFLGLTQANRLRIQSGPFKAFIDCVELDGLPHQKPEGERYSIDGKTLLEGINVCLPFVGNDASRPWTNGLLIRDGSFFATNNVCLVEYWLGGETVPLTLNIPSAALKELQRVKEPPVSIRATDHSVTFEYSDGRWIRSQLYSTEWPDIRQILEQPHNATPVPELLPEAVNAVKQFVEKDGRVYFREGSICTSQEEGLGASFAVPNLHPKGIYHVKMIELLLSAATRVDFTRYPEHLIFYGDRLRGAIIGQRL